MSDHENGTADRIRQQMMVRNFGVKDEDFDICICGDYRHQHENGTGKCNVCHWMPYPEGGCIEFVLAQRGDDPRNLPLR